MGAQPWGRGHRTHHNWARTARDKSCLLVWEWNCRLHLRSLKWKSKSLSHVWLFATPRTIYSPWNSLGQNTGVGNLSLLQGIIPTQGSNPDPALQVDSLPVEPQGSLRTLEQVAYPFPRGSSWPRNWTGVFSFAGRFFTNWAIRSLCSP